MSIVAIIGITVGYIMLCPLCHSFNNKHLLLPNIKPQPRFINFLLMVFAPFFTVVTVVMIISEMAVGTYKKPE